MVCFVAWNQHALRMRARAAPETGAAASLAVAVQTMTSSDVRPDWMLHDRPLAKRHPLSLARLRHATGRELLALVEAVMRSCGGRGVQFLLELVFRLSIRAFGLDVFLRRYTSAHPSIDVPPMLDQRFVDALFFFWLLFWCQEKKIRPPTRASTAMAPATISAIAPALSLLLVSSAVEERSMFTI